AWRYWGCSPDCYTCGSARPQSTPRRLGRKAHQDRVDVAARPETEQGAAIVHEVELGVAAAPFELLALIGLAPLLPHPAAHDLGKHVEERLADVAGKSEVALELRLVGAFEVVIEDAADPA